MKINYKKIFGVLVAILMVLFVVHRPILHILGNGMLYDCVALFCTPFYIDAWLLYLDPYWPFDMEVTRKSMIDNNINSTLGFISIILSGTVLSSIFNTFIVVSCVSFIKEFFFDE